MRGYFVDELNSDEVNVLRTRLQDAGFSSSMEDLFWLPVPHDFLNDLQREHQPQCGPYSLALELNHSALRLEFLMRGQNNLRCECLEFATSALRRHMTDYVERLLEELNPAPLVS